MDKTVRWESTAKIFCVLVDASVVFVGFSVWLAVARHDMTCPRWLPVLATTTFALYLGWNSIAVFVEHRRGVGHGDSGVALGPSAAAKVHKDLAFTRRSVQLALQ